MELKSGWLHPYSTAPPGIGCIEENSTVVTPLSLAGFSSWDFVAQKQGFAVAGTILMLELHRPVCVVYE